MAEASHVSGQENAAADPLIGRVLNGRFTILEPLGTGGMGKVYKALQAPLNRVVALKVLNSRYGAGKDPGFKKRFFLEASMTSKLHHPNTITVHDYGRTDDGIYYIAMEYAEGQTLAHILKAQGRLPWTRALQIAQQVCRSLREAHRLGIIHRDLKPANVMILNEDGDHDMIKVLDFGLVKPFMGDLPPGIEHTELTQAGVLLGSPLYMAPEQARNESDPRSDVYSLGVVMYQMMAGRPPFEGKESIDVIIKHIREKPPPLRSFAPEVPPDVEAFVHRCLAKDPSRRPQSMDEVIELMRELAAAAGLSGVWSNPRASAVGALGAAGLDVSVTSHRSGLRSLLSHKKLAIGLLSSGVVIGFLGVVYMSTRPTDPAPAAPARTTSVTERSRDVRGTARAKEPSSLPPMDDLESADPPMPVPVRFQVSTTPQGAHVSMDGLSLGSTPVEVSLPPGSNGLASAELTLSLAGFQTEIVTAAGSGPEVSIHKDLIRVPEPAPPPKSGARPAKRPKRPSSGYKDDPYR